MSSIDIARLIDLGISLLASGFLLAFAYQENKWVRSGLAGLHKDWSGLTKLVALVVGIGSLARYLYISGRQTGLTLLIAVLMGSVYVKLAARIKRRVFLSWERSFAYSAATSMASISLTYVFFVALGLPKFAVLSVNGVALLVIGGWVLSKLAVDENGRPLRLGSGMQVTVIVFMLGLATSLILSRLIAVLRDATPA